MLMKNRDIQKEEWIKDMIVKHIQNNPGIDPLDIANDLDIPLIRAVNLLTYSHDLRSWDSWLKRY